MRRIADRPDGEALHEHRLLESIGAMNPATLLANAVARLYLRDMREEARRLIKQAERDLENARKNIGIEAYDLASFVAQQAVEKFLKAAWMVAEGRESPRTHSLVELGDPLGVPSGLRKHLVYLNADYTTARYPDAANGVPYEIYDRETAESKVAAAEELFQWLRSLTSG